MVTESLPCIPTTFSMRRERLYTPLIKLIRFTQYPSQYNIKLQHTVHRSVLSYAASTVPSLLYPESTVPSLATSDGINTFPIVERMVIASSADGIYVQTSGIHKLCDSDTLSATSAVNARRVNTSKWHIAITNEISTIRSQ